MEKLIGMSSLAGLMILVVLSQVYPEEVGISQIDRGYIGSRVVVSGYAIRYYISETYSLYNLAYNSSEIKLVFFKLVNMSGKQKILGVVQEYEGELELIGIKILS